MSQKILIVEDDEGMREVMAAALTDMGEVLTATDGISALEIAQREIPDVVLLDIMLPGMTGYQVCSKIRSMAEVSGVPVIMVTGQNIDEAARKGIEVGAEDVLAKPFNLSELKLRVKTILQLNRNRLMVAERSRFRWVVDNARVGYIFLDNEDTCTYINPRALEYFGMAKYNYPKESKQFFSIIKTDFKRVSEHAWESWPQLKDQAFLVRKDSEGGDPVWIKVDYVPGSDAGMRVLRLIDVTESMLAFQNMCQFENLVTHKLSRPLAELVSSLDSIEIRRDEFSEEISTLVDETRESVGNLNKSIERVLEHVASQETAEDEIITAGIVDSFVRQLASTYNIKDLKVEIDASVHMREMKLSSEEMLQILQELYDNSIKYHPEQMPTIGIKMFPKDGERITLEFSDDGVSLSQEKLSTVATPFYRPEEGVKESMGFGLSMIGSMLTTRGGSCRVSNNPEGAGIVVSLDLPVA